MRTRIVLGTCMLAAIAALVAIDEVFDTRAAASTLILVLGLAGWCETAFMSGVASRARGGGPWLFLAGLLGTAYFLALGWREAASGASSPPLLASGVAAVLFLGFAAAVFRSDYIAAFPCLLATFLGVLLFGFLFSYLFRLYHLEDGSLIAGVYLLGIKGNDIAAYFVGRAIGRTRVLKVSPKKTLEGCAAGIIFSALWFGAAGALRPDLFFPWPWALGLGIILAVTAQIGDLSESLIKRFYQVKDSANLFPEFGGVLDLIDSTLFSGFLFWMLLSSHAFGDRPVAG
jgi:phosphatidate cytidylyltransferase